MKVVIDVFWCIHDGGRYRHPKREVFVQHHRCGYCKSQINHLMLVEKLLDCPYRLSQLFVLTEWGQRYMRETEEIICSLPQHFNLHNFLL